MKYYFWGYIGKCVSIIIIALFALLVHACSLGPTRSANDSTPVMGSTNTAYKTTPTPTATMTSSPTATFTPTASPEPKIPVLIGTPIPELSAAISAENAERLTELACWGKAAILRMEYSQESNELITLDICGNINFHDPETLTLLRTLHPGGQVSGLQLMPDGKTIITTLNGDFQFIDIDSGTVIRVLPGFLARQFVVSPDGSMIALMNPEGYYVINTETGHDIWSLLLPEDFAMYSLRPRLIEFAFSSDGKTFVINPDGNLNIYTVPDFTLIKTLDRTSAWGSSGELLYSRDDSSIFFIEQIWDSKIITKVKRWDLNTEKLGNVYQYPDSEYYYRRTYRTIQLSRDEKTLYIVENQAIVEWNLSDGTASYLYTPLSNDESKYITQLVERPDQKSLYLSTSQGDIYIWNLEKKQVEAAYSGDPAEWSEFPVLISDPAVVIGRLRDSGLFLRSLVDGLLIRTIQTGTKFSGESLHQNLLAAQNSDNLGEISVFDVNTGDSILSLMYNPGRYVNAVFAPDGSRLALSSDERISILDIPSGERLFDLATLSSVGIDAMNFSPDGQTLATGDANKQFIRLWDVQTGELIRKIQFSSEESPYVFDLEWSQDSNFLVSADNYANIILWDVMTGKLLYTWNICPNQVLPVFLSFLHEYHVSHCSNSGSVAISPDGKLIAAYENGGYIILLDVESKQYLKFIETSFYGDDSAYTQIAFSTDGKYLYSYNSFDGIVRVWGIISQEEGE
jgi:WD40 repeat protein